MPDHENSGYDRAEASEPPRKRSSESGPIQASGGLVWREGSHGRQIAVIHRSRYDEWALPKGKPEPGESLEATSLREVREETGIEAEIIGYAGATHYEVEGRPKVVHFWNMRVRSQGEFQPGEEVDRVVWLSGEDALRRLEHEEEIRLLASQLERDLNLEER